MAKLSFLMIWKIQVKHTVQDSVEVWRRGNSIFIMFMKEKRHLKRTERARERERERDRDRESERVRERERGREGVRERGREREREKKNEHNNGICKMIKMQIRLCCIHMTNCKIWRWLKTYMVQLNDEQ